MPTASPEPPPPSSPPAPAAAASRPEPRRPAPGTPAPGRPGLVLALAALYAAQGVPFGLAAEYLPVALRRAGLGMGAIAATFWLQVPWQAKVLWARTADTPWARSRARGVVLVLQLALGAAIALHASLTLPGDLRAWLVLTLVCAVCASSQDVFVDAFAVRSLRPHERGLGNVAQVAGYRAGMLLGGGGLLFAGALAGPRVALAGLGVLVAGLAACAFVVARASGAGHDGPDGDASPREAPGLRALLARLTRRDARPVLLVAVTFKLGIHLASPLVKPMVVDGGFTDAEVGLVVVTLGAAASFAGAVLGGLLHRRLGEPRALAASAVLHAVAVAPLVVVERAGVPFAATAACVTLEHLASAAGTTVLFAALMSAARPSAAGFHYTLLTSLNALAIGLGGQLGGGLADRLGRAPVYALASALCLVPLAFVRRWRASAAASAAEASAS